MRQCRLGGNPRSRGVPSATELIIGCHIGLAPTSPSFRPSRLRTHYPSQKVTVAAMQIAEKKVWAQRS